MAEYVVNVYIGPAAMVPECSHPLEGSSLELTFVQLTLLPTAAVTAFQCQSGRNSS
jgi:hypothetical protein